MRLSSDEISRRFDARTLKLAFIGMSNIGKSYTAKRLKDAYGFHRIEVDTIIWEGLGYDTMAELAAWQGQPYEDGYAEREAESLRLEKQACHKAMDIGLGSTLGNVIIDTPGSVIYTGDDTLERLKSEYLVVHIKAGPDDFHRLEREYFERPKPLIWAGHFKASDSLTDLENIRACYPHLLAARAKLYAALSDITLQSQFITDPLVTPEDIFTKIIASH